MKQIIYELKSQPIVSCVTIIGIALAIFIIMITVMLQQVTVMPIAPESDRARMLYVDRGNIVTSENSLRASASLADGTLRNLIYDLDGVENVSIFSTWIGSSLLSSPDNPTFSVDVLKTDNSFFNIYDFVFIAGKPYTDTDVSSGLRKAVLTESVARETFGSPESAVGKDIELNDVTYTVTGVTRDVSPVTNRAYAQVWTVLTPSDPNRRGLGEYGAAIKAVSSDRFNEIADEINRRAEIFSSSLQLDDDLRFNLEGGAKDQEGFKHATGADNEGLATKKRSQWFLYFILLLIPAINLSTMTRSRLRLRRSEIGVRRAFGCTRTRIIYDLLAENLMVTVAGGIIGLACCMIFGSLLFDTIYQAGGYWSRYNVASTISFSSLLDWRIFAYTIFFCFILNLLSTGFPALQASRVSPVEAINSTSR